MYPALLPHKGTHAGGHAMRSIHYASPGEGCYGAPLEAAVTRQGSVW